MEFIKEKNRVYLKNENGEIVAEIEFLDTAPGEVSITHTFVDQSLRGQQMAAKLTEAACEAIQEQGKKVRPLCSYAVKWFRENPEKEDILAK